MRTDGIIFDMDGTLWDSSRVVAESWRATLGRDFGCALAPDAAAVRSIMGMTAADIARKLFYDFGDDALKVCLQCIKEENEYIARHSGDVYPGVEDMLSELSERCGLYIVSNCLDGYIQCFLRCTGFDRYIRDFECEGRTGLDKAGNISLVIRRNGLRAPVYIGDTAGDERSAAAAGCVFIHAAYGFGTAEAPAAVIKRPGDLPGVISGLKGESVNA